jgi:hypothetical protein
MSKRLTQTERKQYSSQFASKITEDFFNGKEFASGEDILSLTPVQQINHSIIQKLYGQWQKDALAFRSPYFDFENTEVKEALESFMNIVSRHIAVGKADLTELLKDATDNTLLQVFEPATYFGNQLREFPDMIISVDRLKEMRRFNKIHKGVIEGLTQKLAESGESYVYVNQANRWLDELIANPTTLDSVDEYLESFSKIIPFEFEKTVVSQPAETVKKDEKSFFDYVQNETPPAERVISGAHIAKTVHPEVPEVQKEDLSLNSSFKTNQPGPNNYSHIKIESIAGSIPLAQRFVYISQLFKGNADEFDQSIKMLDRCSSFTEAHEFIHKSLAHRYDWDPKSERVKELLATVRRKFN